MDKETHKIPGGERIREGQKRFSGKEFRKLARSDLGTNKLNKKTGGSRAWFVYRNAERAVDVTTCKPRIPGSPCSMERMPQAFVAQGGFEKETEKTGGEGSGSLALVVGQR